MHKTYYAMSTFPNFLHFISIFKELVSPQACCPVQ